MEVIVVQQRIGGNAWTIYQNGNDMYFGAWNNTPGEGWWTATATDVLTIGLWTHITGVYNGTHILIYSDGLFKQAILIPFVKDVTGGVRIGWDSMNSGRQFNGTIDEVRIWSRALVPEETVVMKQII